MKFYYVDKSGKRRRLTKNQAGEYLSELQIKEAIEAKRADPLEEVSYMAPGGMITLELE